MLDAYATSYEAYALKKGKMSVDRYVAEHSGELGETGAIRSWCFDYFYDLMPEYVQHLEYQEIHLWALANHYSDELLFYYLLNQGNYSDAGDGTIMGYGYDEIYLYQLYYRINGENAGSHHDLEALIGQLPSYESLSAIVNKYYPEWEEHLKNNYYHGYQTTFILSDNAYRTLTYSLGKSDPEVMSNLYFDYGYYTPMFEPDPMYYLMIHSTDVRKTQSYLNEKLGSENFMTPNQYLTQLVSSEFPSIIGSVISFVSMLALACVFIYFIMRSSLMSKVKEIGIYRAIGVSKKNLTFKFFIDTNFVCLTTFAPGFILASAALSSISSSFLFSSYYSYPIWLAIPVFVFVYAVCLLLGMLPVFSLLKRTPSNILSKYDI